MAQVQSLADAFLAHPKNAGLFAAASARWHGLVGDPTQAVAEVVDAAAFIAYPPEPFAVYHLDAASIPDPAMLAAARAEYGSYVSPHVAGGDCLVWVDWVASSGETFATLAVAAPSGAPKLEPLADVVVDATSSPDTAPSVTDAARAPPTGVDTQTWKNLIGVTKAWGQLQVSALGADGCHASFTANFTSGAAFPFVVEPATAQPAVTITCFPKRECTCRSGGEVVREKMECGQASQSYSVIARIGTQWFGADLVSYSGTVRAWACADGQAGSGNW